MSIVIRTLVIASLLVLIPPTGYSVQAQSSSSVGAQQYTCPMHPHYIATDADGACPICGMDLVPTSTANVSTSGDAVVIAPRIIQSIGVRTAEASVQTITESLRAFGVVAVNERLDSVAVARLEGWIATLAVKAEGAMVAPGSLLYRVYSPELIAAQKEFLTSLAKSDSDRQRAVRQRLRSLGMQEQVIDRVAEQKKIIENVPIYAEGAGTVAALQVREGDYIKPGTPILRLQSYATVWVMASIPEADLPRVSPGITATLDFPSAPNAVSEGVINYVYPTINARTRTAQARIQVDNRDGSIRPGAYVDVTLALRSDERLVVPSESLLHDSRGTHVIVALGEGRFGSRTVATGVRGAGLTEITSGLSAGEQVVVSGQFLLDSEVNLREGFAKLQPSQEVDGSSAYLSATTPLDRLPISQEALVKIDHLVDMALYFHEALVDQYVIEPSYIEPAIKAAQHLQRDFSGSRLTPVLEDSLRALRAAKTGASSGKLSEHLAQLVDSLMPWLLHGAPAHYAALNLVIFEDDATSHRWLQEDTRQQNPYSKQRDAHRVPWPTPSTSAKATTRGQSDND